ncbi:MAG: NAD(P)-dependent oxidoreductase, partial [Moraxellaceae bacterium]
MAIPQKVMITGANGFIGRAIAQRFLELGSSVVGVDLQANPAMNVYSGNVAVAGEWQKLAKGCDLVIHTAAVVSNTASAELYREVSVGSVRKVIEAAIYGDASRVLHFSSIAAYGLDFATQRTETDDICLLTGHPYCDAKAASEHAVLAAHASGDMACTIIRPGDVYGPGSRPWVLIPLSLIRKNQFLLPAKGQGVFSDLSQAVQKLKQVQYEQKRKDEDAEAAYRQSPVVKNQAGQAIIQTRDKNKNINAEFIVDEEMWHDLNTLTWSL